MAKLPNTTRPTDAERTSARADSLERDHELPTYQESEVDPVSSQRAQAFDSTNATSNTLGPSISAPFAFPTSDQRPPEYTSSTLSKRPIAIPQRFPDPAAPFLPAYAPLLLSHGIPAESWYSFLDTLSAFLTAKVGQQAIDHAADFAKSVSDLPKKLGKDVANHVKDTFRAIGKEAKKKNVVGVVGGVIGGTIALTVGTALKVTATAVTLPITAIGASMTVKTPRQRAEAYTAAANKQWFHKRGLHARIMDSTELSIYVDVSLQQLLDAVNIIPPDQPERQMEALRDLIEGVELRRSSPSPVLETPSAQKLSPAGFPADTKQPLSEGPLHGSPDMAGPSQASSSSQTQTMPAKGPPDRSYSLHVGAPTLWIVLFMDETLYKKEDGQQPGQHSQGPLH